MKTVSVIIPAYNRAHYIREAIESALQQSHRPLEIIVVDDGSTDETPQILATYSEPVRVFRQVNQGVAAARNLGVSHARGEYVAFLDSDDLWHPEKLEKQIERFEADPELGLVHCGMETFNDAGEVLEVNVGGAEGWVSHEMLLLRRLVIIARSILAVLR